MKRSRRDDEAWRDALRRGDPAAGVSALADVETAELRRRALRGIAEPRSFAPRRAWVWGSAVAAAAGCAAALLVVGRGAPSRPAAQPAASIASATAPTTSAPAPLASATAPLAFAPSVSQRATIASPAESPANASAAIAPVAETTRRAAAAKDAAETPHASASNASETIAAAAPPPRALAACRPRRIEMTTSGGTRVIWLIGGFSDL